MIQNSKGKNRPKGKIVIPELIKKLRQPTQKCIDSNRQEADKENHPFNTLPENLQHKVIQKLEDTPFRRQKQLGENNREKRGQKKEEIKQMKTSQSTYRGIEGDSLNEQSSIQSCSEFLLKKKNNEFLKLQSLLSAEKMFINPDKWSEYVNRAVNDEQFHKALNVFMYSYFIQNYN